MQYGGDFGAIHNRKQQVIGTPRQFSFALCSEVLLALLCTLNPIGANRNQHCWGLLCALAVPKLPGLNCVRPEELSPPATQADPGERMRTFAPRLLPKVKREWGWGQGRGWWHEAGAATHRLLVSVPSAWCWDTPCSCCAHSMLMPRLLLARRDSFWLQRAVLYYYLWKRCSSQLPKYHVCMRLVKIKMAKTEALARVKFREQILGIYSPWSG